MILTSSFLNRVAEILILIFLPLFILSDNGGEVVLLIMLVVNLTYLAVNRNNKISYSFEEKKLLLVIGLYIGLHY